MAPMTPNGTRILPTMRPFGSVRISIVSPTGSGSDATLRTSFAMASRRASVSVRRSMTADESPSARPRSRSCAFAARIAGAFVASASARPLSAAFFTCEDSVASRRAACFASLAFSAISDVAVVMAGSLARRAERGTEASD